MAATYREQSENEVSRRDIQDAIAKAVELRALHSALMQGTSPKDVRFPFASPVSRHAQQLSARDYPVFTPSREDESLPGYQKILLQNRNYAESWGEQALSGGNADETESSEYRTMDASLIKGFPLELTNLEGHVCPSEDQNSMACCTKSRRSSLGDLKSLTSCNNCQPASISTERLGIYKNDKKSKSVVPSPDSHSSVHSQPRNKGMKFSWLFPKLKKKNRNDNAPPIQSQPTEVSQVLGDSGMISIEAMKKEVAEANKSRDAALVEVSDMRVSLGELSQKLEYLETYCEGHRKALTQVVEVKNSQSDGAMKRLSKRGKLFDVSAENLMPVSEEAMVEGFLQIVSEARLSVKQFCKILIGLIQDSDHSLMDNLNSILQPYNLSLNSKQSKAVLYHLEAVINQSLYQDFENCVFQRNGIPKFLDPQQDRQEKFQSFIALRNLRWNEVLRKGTKYYSEEFSKFCDQKMNGIVASLGWTRPWPEQLLQAFFVSAKCIWLVHLLAFSFDPPSSILRVEEKRPFEARYEEDVFADRQNIKGSSRVKIMVTPGFYVHDIVVRCKVVCRYK
ncbi:IRK-interacting protein-like [Primulina huaijiensis]|uniref:IRK-interacting protein-like n=1 Tax=Primulina huaijiensis TaxID=1492673 RepID=UPI003CC7033E